MIGTILARMFAVAFLSLPVVFLLWVAWPASPHAVMVLGVILGVAAASIVLISGLAYSCMIVEAWVNGRTIAEVMDDYAAKSRSLW